MTRRAALAWLVPLLLLALWQAGSSLGAFNADILPGPASVARAGWERLRSGELLRNMEISAWRAGVGLLIGGSLGFVLGIANGMLRVSETLLDGTIQMVRNIPHLALIPLVILWFGVGDPAKLFLVALGVFFPIYANTFHGVRTADPLLVEMGRAYGMSEWTLFRRVILPGALPAIFVGLRYALGIMWLTLIVAETISSNAGIGYMAMNAREFMMVDVVMLSILIYALLGKLADSLVRVLERVCLSWNKAYARA